MKNMSAKTQHGELDPVDAATLAEAGADELSFEQLLALHDVPKPIGYGTVVTGTILPYQHGSHYFVDIGQKADAVLAKDDAAELQPGDVAEFVVVSDPEDHDGSVTLSYSRLKKEKAVKAAWETLARLVETGDIATAIIGDPEFKDDDRGGRRICGFNATINGIDAFIPASQIDTVLPPAQLKGKELPVKVLNAEQKRRRSNVVLSHKEASRVLLPGKLATIEAGTSLTGTVSLIMLQSKSARTDGAARQEIGALVEIEPGVTGFVHKSEFANDRRIKPSDLVKVGDTVEVVVSNVDLGQNRLSLSFKAHEANKDAVASVESAQADKAKSALREKLGTLSPGQAVSGKVKIIIFETDYQGPADEKRELGAIVKLDNGVEAFLHRNECSDSRLVNPSHLFKVDDVIECEVKFVDLDKGRVQLSYKRVAANQDAITAKQKELQQQFKASLKIGDKREGTVSRQPEQFGVFVRLGGGIEGLIHVSTLEPNASLQDAALKQFRPGKTVTVEIIKIDEHNGFTRIGLSLVK